MKRKPDPQCLFVVEILHSVEGSWSCNGNRGGGSPGAAGCLALSFRPRALRGRDSAVGPRPCLGRKRDFTGPALLFGAVLMFLEEQEAELHLCEVCGAFLQQAAKPRGLLWGKTGFLGLAKAGQSAPIHYLLIYDLICTL